MFYVLGVDPGNYIAYVLLDMNYNIIKYNVKRDSGFSFIYNEITNYDVIYVATDKQRIPKTIRLFANKLNSKIITPKRDIDIITKNKIIQDKRYKILNNEKFGKQHLRDALSASFFAVDYLNSRINTFNKYSNELNIKNKNLILRKFLISDKIFDSIKNSSNKNEFNNKDNYKIKDHKQNNKDSIIISKYKYSNMIQEIKDLKRKIDYLTNKNKLFSFIINEINKSKKNKNNKEKYNEYKYILRSYENELNKSMKINSLLFDIINSFINKNKQTDILIWIKKYREQENYKFIKLLINKLNIKYFYSNKDIKKKIENEFNLEFKESNNKELLFKTKDFELFLFKEININKILNEINKEINKL